MKLAPTASHPDNDSNPIHAMKISALGPASGSGSRIVAFNPDSPRRPLTDREKQILRLVCDGLTNAEIGLKLGISSETVKSELKRIFRKIEVKNRTQAAVLLIKQGLL